LQINVVRVQVHCSQSHRDHVLIFHQLVNILLLLVIIVIFLTLIKCSLACKLIIV
jgi:hypothetical protein